MHDHEPNDTLLPPTGYAYHSRTGCPRLSRSTDIYELTVGEAKDDGYEPCDFCN